MVNKRRARAKARTPPIAEIQSQPQPQPQPQPQSQSQSQPQSQSQSQSQSQPQPQPQPQSYKMRKAWKSPGVTAMVVRGMSSGDAERMQRLQDELDAAVENESHLRARCAFLAKQLSETTDRAERITKDFHSAVVELNLARKELEQASQDQKSLFDRYQKELLENHTLYQQLKLMSEENAALQAENERLRERVSSLEDRLTKLQNEYDRDRMLIAISQPIQKLQEFLSIDLGEPWETIAFNLKRESYCRTAPRTYHDRLCALLSQYGFTMDDYQWLQQFKSERNRLCHDASSLDSCIDTLNPEDRARMQKLVSFLHRKEQSFQ